MGQTIRKLFDNFFGNTEMRVCCFCPSADAMLCFSWMNFNSLGHCKHTRQVGLTYAGGDAWSGCSRQNYHTVQVAHRRNTLDCANHW